MTKSRNRHRVVLVHGITGSRRFFTALENRLRGLPLQAETLSLDLLGFGENRDLPGAFGVEDQLQHISHPIQRRFLDGPVAIIGHSLGGVLALSWTVQHAPCVSAIILLNTPLGENREDTTRSLRAAPFCWATLLLKHPRLSHVLCVLLRGGHLMRLFGFMKPGWVPDEVFRDYCHRTWRSLSFAFNRLVLAMPAGPLVRQISGIPILNLTGNADDEISRRTIDQRNVENVVLPGGHLMLLEHPEPTTRAIEQFLMRVRT